jgi:cytochrome b6-f complex iron-sulfur subunit
MQRRKFSKTCGYSALGIPFAASFLTSCGGLYYAASTPVAGKLMVAKSEFVKIQKNKKIDRSYVLLKTNASDFPICVFKSNDDDYIASLLKCTHRGCELNIGGGIYSCPCHGSEFSMIGKLLQGPADRDLKTFKTETDAENIYIHLS